MNYDPDYEVEESAGDSPSQWLNFDDCEDEDGRPRRWKKAKKSKASPVQRLQQQLQLGPRLLITIAYKRLALECQHRVRL